MRKVGMGVEPKETALESLKKENETLRTENESLKAENETLRTEKVKK
ncbi:hypothetical protein [Lacrimispora sp.]|nr:hypothetical protein [Lacrimispora sp.]